MDPLEGLLKGASELAYFGRTLSSKERLLGYKELARIKRNIDFQRSMRKHTREAKSEIKYDDYFNEEMAKFDDPNFAKKTGVKAPKHVLKRNLRLRVPDNVIQWMKDNGHSELVDPYKKFVKSEAKTKNEMSSFLAKELGLSVEKEHYVPVSGAVEDLADITDTETKKVSPKPYQSRRVQGADSEGGPGSGKWNRKIGNKRAFALATLQQLNQPVNWIESATNFVAKRPDLKSSLDNRVLGSDFLRLQQGLATGDQIELEGFRRADLRRSGLKNTVNYERLFRELIRDIDAKMTVSSATDTTPGKKAWNVTTKRRGTLSPDDQTRHDAAKRPRDKYKSLTSQLTGSKWSSSLLADAAKTPIALQEEIASEVKKDKPHRKQSSRRRLGVLHSDEDTWSDPVLFSPPIHYINKSFDLEL